MHPKLFFFKRAHEFLNYLNDNSDIDLYGVGILKNDKPLREALFRDLDRTWQVYEGANQIRQLHDHWTRTSINLNMSFKQGTSYLHGACCGTGVLRCDLHASGLVVSDKCRKGCQEKETLDHVILGCPFYAKERGKLTKECEKLKLDVNVKNAICHPGLHLTTEKFFASLSIKNV